MSANQTKLAHQLILVTNAFLHPINKREEKTYAHHPFSQGVSKATRCWLTGCS